MSWKKRSAKHKHSNFLMRISVLPLVVKICLSQFVSFECIPLPRTGQRLLNIVSSALVKNPQKHFPVMCQTVIQCQTLIGHFPMESFTMLKVTMEYKNAESSVLQT